MNNIIAVRIDEQGGFTLDWVDSASDHPDFQEVRATYVSAQAQAKYDYIGKLVQSIVSDCSEILDLIHGYKSGNIKLG